MKSQYVDTKKLEIELYQRFTVPMASLMFALIGAPLGIQPNRSSSSYQFWYKYYNYFYLLYFDDFSWCNGQNSFIRQL